MSKDAYQVALQRVDALRKELAELEQFIAVYQRLAGDNVNAAAPDVQKPPENQQDKTQPAQLQIRPRGRLSKPLKPKEIARIAKDIILAHGAPMTRGKLATAIESRGHLLPSDDKARHIGTIMWRNKKTFENVAGEGYWPKGYTRSHLGESTAAESNKTRDLISN
jgi:hypothetical protein